MDRQEIFLYVCCSCGTVTARSTEIADSKPCNACIVGAVKIVNFIAQHEGQVRVKLEVRTP